jgi:hypothetical protein
MIRYFLSSFFLACLRSAVSIARGDCYGCVLTQLFFLFSSTRAKSVGVGLSPLVYGIVRTPRRRVALRLVSRLVLVTR